MKRKILRVLDSIACQICYNLSDKLGEFAAIRVLMAEHHWIRYQTSDLMMECRGIWEISRELESNVWTLNSLLNPFVHYEDTNLELLKTKARELEDSGMVPDIDANPPEDDI